jgi:transcriptional regulator with XRE-family HTH domain
MYEYYAMLRDAKGLTDYKVAKLSGVSRSTLSDWKTGKHTPTFENISKIAKALGVEPSDILGRFNYDFFQQPYKDGFLTIEVENQRKLENERTKRLLMYSKLFNDKLVDLLDNDSTRELLKATEGCTDEEIQLAHRMLSMFQDTNKRSEQ